MRECFVSYKALHTWKVALFPEKEITIQEEFFLMNLGPRNRLLPVAENRVGE